MGKSHLISAHDSWGKARGFWESLTVIYHWALDILLHICELYSSIALPMQVLEWMRPIQLMALDDRNNISNE